VCGVKDIKGVDKDVGCISDGKSLLDGLAQDMSILVVNVFIVASSGASDFESLVLVKGQGFLIGSLDMQVYRSNVMLLCCCSMFEDVIQELAA
jgi:hypothetical protein